MKTIIKAFKIAFKAAPVGVIFFLIFGILVDLIMTYPALIAIKQITKYVYYAIDSSVIELMLIFWIVVYASTSTLIPDFFSALNNYFYHKIFPLIDMMVNKLYLNKMYYQENEIYFRKEFLDGFERVRGELYKVQSFILSVFNVISKVVLGLSLVISLIFILNPLVVTVFIILAVSTGLLQGRFEKERVKLRKELTGKWRKNNYYEDLMSVREYSKEVRLNRTQDKLRAKWREYFVYLKYKWYDLDKKAMIVWSFFTIISLIINYSYNIYLFYLLKQGGIDLSTFVMLVAGINTLFNVIKGIVTALSSDFVNLYETTSIIVDFLDDADFKNVSNKIIELSKEQKLIYNDFESLEIRNVNYKYPSQQGMALSNINLKIEKGEIVSILGYNGSGKSTLSKIITKTLSPKDGQVLINGHDISNDSVIDVSKYFGVAYQDFNRFSFSLKDNVRVGLIEKYFDKIELDEAYEKGNLESIIQKLPNKDQTLLGKEFDVKGNDLSGGEWQRIILARAYFGNCQFVILDEPTASIDPFEEMRMLNRFKEIIDDKTALLISHRIGFARLADRIIMMDDGRIIEDGTHEELIEIENGKYRQLYESQQALYKRGDEHEEL